MLADASRNAMQAFEMWSYRRMLRISYMYDVTNTTVLQLMQKSLEIVDTIKERKLAYLGHGIRNSEYKLLQLILQGNIDSKWNIGVYDPGRHFVP